MPKGFKPSIFVSSTCFDLGQVRADLKQFIESLGFDPVLSEFNSFPINPSYDTIRNCKENVKNRSDIFVLIVGGRYGNMSNDGKSITNMEYIEATVKGIPTYTFIAKNIINVFPVWKKNKNADFFNVVDSNKLFEFVESLYDRKDKWVFSFESAQDICETLKKQLSYLFMDCLELRSMVTPSILDDKEFAELSPKSLQILLYKPLGWEYRLFAELLKEYIEKQYDIRRDLSYGVSFGKRTVLKNSTEIVDWVSHQFDHITTTMEYSTKLLNEGLPIAFGEPGKPGDAKHIHYIAKRFTEGYKKLIEWRLEFLALDVNKKFNRLLDLASQMASNAIGEIEEYAIHIHRELNDAFDNIDNYKVGTKITLILKLTAPDTTEFAKEVNRIKLGES